MSNGRPTNGARRAAAGAAAMGAAGRAAGTFSHRIAANVAKFNWRKKKRHKAGQHTESQLKQVEGW